MNEPQQKDQMPDLGTTKRDVAVGLVRGAVGAIPVAGSIFSEIIGELVPQQRIERIAIYVQLLNDRLGRLEELDRNVRLRNPENIDLFEEGAFQSAKALSDERRIYIANLVATGITGAEKERLESKRLLNLLRELDDAEIIVLASNLQKNQDDEFWNRHDTVLHPVLAHLGSSQEELDAATVQQLARTHLSRLGLLKPRFARPRKNELPEFDDNTGMIKASGDELTSLARLLLRRIGLAGDQDF